jgi:D-amino-acid dehydrogenase
MTQRVAVVGAGMAGLATAWFLQEHGSAVTVLERDRVAAGASWGNAGWLMAGDSTPLPHPDVLRYGLRAWTDPSSAFSVPWRADLGLYRFLLQFARHCTPRHWEDGVRAFAPLANGALAAYDALERGGVTPTSRSTSHLACFADLSHRDEYAAHLEHLRHFGFAPEFEVLDAGAAMAATPVASSAVRGAVALRGQRFLDPTSFLPSLADSVVTRGGELRVGTEVKGLRAGSRGVEVLLGSDSPRIERYDAVVVCTGAWLSTLVRRHGVRVRVRAGRGYSFTARLDVPVDDPVYLPDQHVACTPMRGRLRLAGLMEFRRPGDPLDPRRIRALVEAARPMLVGVDLDDRDEEWVGPRPVASDGLPLAGPTSTPGVWCVGGHAMEGMVLGPVTARLVAEGVASGAAPDVLRPFDPRR